MNFKLFMALGFITTICAEPQRIRNIPLHAPSNIFPQQGTVYSALFEYQEVDLISELPKTNHVFDFKNPAIQEHLSHFKKAQSHPQTKKIAELCPAINAFLSLTTTTIKQLINSSEKTALLSIKFELDEPQDTFCAMISFEKKELKIYAQAIVYKLAKNTRPEIMNLLKSALTTKSSAEMYWAKGVAGLGSGLAVLGGIFYARRDNQTRTPKTNPATNSSVDLNINVIRDQAYALLASDLNWSLTDGIMYYSYNNPSGKQSFEVLPYPQRSPTLDGKGIVLWVNNVEKVTDENVVAKEEELTKINEREIVGTQDKRTYQKVYYLLHLNAENKVCISSSQDGTKIVDDVEVEDSQTTVFESLEQALTVYVTRFKKFIEASDTSPKADGGGSAGALDAIPEEEEEEASTPRSADASIGAEGSSAVHSEVAAIPQTDGAGPEVHIPCSNTWDDPLPQPSGQPQGPKASECWESWEDCEGDTGSETSESFDDDESGKAGKGCCKDPEEFEDVRNFEEYGGPQGSKDVEDCEDERRSPEVMADALAVANSLLAAGRTELPLSELMALIRRTHSTTEGSPHPEAHKKAKIQKIICTIDNVASRITNYLHRKADRAAIAQAQGNPLEEQKPECFIFVDPQDSATTAGFNPQTLQEMVDGFKGANRWLCVCIVKAHTGDFFVISSETTEQTNHKTLTIAEQNAQQICERFLATPLRHKD